MVGAVHRYRDLVALDTAEAVERLLSGRRVRNIETLRSSQRTQVERVTLVAVEGQVDQVVAKRHLDVSGFAREAAALSVLPDGLPAPVLIAEDRAEMLVVMTDAGRGTSVADALLGLDPEEAEHALGHWVVALAELHRSTGKLRSSFATALAVRQPDGGVAVDPMPDYLAQVPDGVRSSDAGLKVPSGVDVELGVISTTLNQPAWDALSPGDTCPDNNVITESGFTLIDFEGASVRNVAWDLAYLRVPWPSCWCAWGIPEQIASATLERYFRAMSQTVIGADRDAFDLMVDHAVLAWALISGSWFLRSGLLRDDTMGPPGFVAPPRRATVLERFRVAADTAERLGYGTLAVAARSWQQALVRLWGPQHLPFAPALR
jgi:hypothetical protein